MKGQILSIDESTRRGLITARDGRRYSFEAGDLCGAGELAHAGVAVDFETAGDTAIAIYPDPGTPVVASHGRKNKVVAALLAFFAGSFGFHKFYLGYNGPGAVMLICTLLGWALLFIPNMIIGAIAFVEALIYITRSDAEFTKRYEDKRRGWF